MKNKKNAEKSIKSNKKVRRKISKNKKILIENGKAPRPCTYFMRKLSNFPNTMQTAGIQWLIDMVKMKRSTALTFFLL